MPERKPKKVSRLPKGRGIHRIEISQPQAAAPEQEASDPDRISIAVSESDRVLLDQIRARLEARNGTPVSTDQIVRWAVWHCKWDTSQDSDSAQSTESASKPE